MYEIKITKIEEVEGIKREYEKLSDAGNERDNGPVYGYVDQKVKQLVRTEVLSQEVENVDVVAVIKAVNGIK